MKLKEYNKKRDFSKSPEPADSFPQKRGGKLIYVIQKHQASRLHYDLRLEDNGVLKSWAIPKEPPASEGLKRLAVATEDHPLGYESFEGTIPEGQYGAGEVMIWDQGVYVPLESSLKKMIFEIKGEKLHGKYCLIKLNQRDPDDKNWLFFKLKNE